MRNLTTRPFAILIAAVCILTAAAACPADEYPYVGQVTGKNVYVRCGYDTNYYPVTKLNKGDRVQVVGESLGWLKILPPTGCFSWIDKKFVQRQGDVGDVSGQLVWVRAGSLLSNNRSSPQVKLNRGDKVTVLGEQEGFYKIASPEGAYLWISAKYVKKLAGVAPTVPAPAATPVAKPTPQPAVAPTPAAQPEPVTAPAPHATQPGKIKSQEAFENLEALAQIESQKPILQRDWQPVLDKFKPLADQTDDLTTAMLSKARIQQIKTLMAMQQSYKQVLDLDSVLKARLRAAEDRRKTIQPPSPKAVRGWDAIGILAVSWVFTGQDVPKLYRLIDPHTTVHVAYVQPTDELADQLQLLVGKHIGVRASEHIYKPRLNIFLLVPEELAKIPIPEPEPPATQPAAPPKPQESLATQPSPE